MNKDERVTRLKCSKGLVESGTPAQTNFIESCITMKIANKRQMYALYESNCLGNKVRTWSSPKEFLAEPNKPEQIGFRYKGDKIGGRNPFWIQPSCNLYLGLEKWLAEGYSFNNLHISESAPNWNQTFQGELQRSAPHGWELYYTLVAKPMREALAEQHATARGYQVLALLHHYLDEASFDDLMELVDLYPDHVIEFSTFCQDVGWARGRNTIYWEVRAY